MIPIKLVETIFLKYWALLIPALLVPLLVIGLTHEPEKYQSTATIWVSQPVAGEAAAIGHTNNWATPAQNQAQVLNDLFSTEAFRVEMLRAAGLVDSSMTEKDAKSAAARVSIWASSSGANLVHITATAAAPETAKKLVDAAIDQYLVRATTEFQRDAELSTTYYTQQLAVANQELATRQAALASYLASHPRAANPTNPESLDIDYKTLVQRVSDEAALISQLQGNLQAIQLREASAPATQQAAFNVQDPAALPEWPLPVSATNKYGMPMAGLLFGLMIGSTYLYVSYRTDHSIRGASDLAALSVPLLGTVPELRAGPRWLNVTPLGWLVNLRHRDFARRTAASITGAPAPAKRG